MSPGSRGVVLALILAVGIGLGLVLTRDGAPPTGDALTPGPAVPELSVERLDGQGTVALSRLAASETPTLLWFWAPWCSVCNAEAPAIEQLASSAGADLSVVAIGGRDDASNGPAFVARHGLRTPLVLFDESIVVVRSDALSGRGPARIGVVPPQATGATASRMAPRPVRGPRGV